MRHPQPTNIRLELGDGHFLEFQLLLDVFEIGEFLEGSFVDQVAGEGLGGGVGFAAVAFGGGGELGGEVIDYLFLEVG